jgi:outer membrane biosynthesis protein TonB
MSNFSRRLFLILLGGLATSGIAQSSDAASTKKPTPTPTPKKKTPKKPTPTPKKTTSKKPTPTPTTKKPTPTPSQSAKATPTPTPSPSKALEGIFIAKSSDLPMRQTKVFFLVDSFGISTS